MLEFFRKLLNKTVFRRESELFIIPYKPLERCDLPPSDPVVAVSQNGYGVSISKPIAGKNRSDSKRMPGKAHLLSCISVCHLIHLSQPNRGVNVLAHLDPRIDNVTARYRI